MVPGQKHCNTIGKDGAQEDGEGNRGDVVEKRKAEISGNDPHDCRGIPEECPLISQKEEIGQGEDRIPYNHQDFVERDKGPQNLLTENQAGKSREYFFIAFRFAGQREEKYGSNDGKK